ncbi:glycerol-3-phosphate acyltransferase 3 isoform X2 [Neocloeon triangulifer]|uniref:glycerol-3-phosphate acyltransferase 3 isoform X2 n=1 Tax=Neocloeon triangulifer TaxID=2078957 RepID=UPI00286F413A|nr:glycerol-3-phosphate acyltransferase 3 isoform X2 [Neocloeon triangulifer]
MAVVGTLVSISGSLLLTPLILFLLVILFLASIGKSIGVRRLYVKTLLTLFEYGRQHIEIANKQKRRSDDSGFNSEDEGDSKRTRTTSEASDDGLQRGRTKGHQRNGSLKNGISLIQREDLILAPDPCHNKSDHNHRDSSNPRHPKSRSHSAGAPRTGTSNGTSEKGENSEQEDEIDNPGLDKDHRKLSFETLKREFDLSDSLTFIKAGVESIIEDEVTQCFEAEELRSWNLLTRTNRHYEFISWRLTVIWMLGFVVRYLFLFPLRVTICFVGVYWLTFCTAVVGYVPAGKFKRWLNSKVSIMCFTFLSSALSAVITYHNPENKPKEGICVANHTSPIDVLVLACDNCYALIGQRHGGFLGLLQRALARASSHIWFERSEVKDREVVTKRLRQHVSDPDNPPILIFPEGTCINNTSVMQFKKGSFEVGGVIYPVAIKYDPKFGDAFWNSSKYSMMQYLYMMMTSWAIVCDVWYLPPMHQAPDENAVDFANRVKSVIATQGGLVDLMWDGQLKRMCAKKEWKERQQEEFSKRLKVE